MYLITELILIGGFFLINWNQFVVVLNYSIQKIFKHKSIQLNVDQIFFKEKQINI